jgi:molybdate transport system regulatory protein
VRLDGTLGTKAAEEGGTMQISARNQLKGIGQSVKLGTIMSEVTVDVGGQEIVAAITRGTVEGLGLQEGSEVTVIILR